MIAEEQIVEKLMGRYQKMDMGSSLEKGQFKALLDRKSTRLNSSHIH